MFHRHVELYLHFIWNTWDRVPWIAPPLRPRLHGVIAAVARRLDCSFVVVGGVEEHVHMLVRASPARSPADLVREFKGASSHFAHAELGVDESCRWSHGYALFSVDPTGVSDLTAYIDNQPRHHAMGTVDPRREHPI